MEERPEPRLSASISLDPRTHSFADSQAPNLSITIVSRCPDPITIYADNLSPALILKCGAFNITSFSSGSDVKQVVTTNCRFLPPSKVPVVLDEARFHTLYPDTPVTISTPFARKRDNVGKPLPGSHPEYNNHRSAKHGIYGVDGLEPGETYLLTLNGSPRVDWTSVRWWEYGTKEQLLCKDLDKLNVKFEHGPHEPIRVDITGCKPITFRCVE